MSREIKFRAWHKPTQLMDDVALIDFYNEKIGILYADPVMQCESMQKFNFNEVEIMQYTGLEDKNGQEIYDGDILKIQTSDFYSKKITDEYIGQICFSRGGFFVLTDGHHTDFCLWGKNVATMEVIGNIYENKGLLEVEERSEDNKSSL